MRLWATIGLCLGIFIIAMDFSIVNTALPSIQKELNSSLVELQWIMNIFALFLCSFLVTMGRAADLFGRRRLFLFGLILFALASLSAGMAVNTGWLIFSRAFQGIASAIVLPCSQALMIFAFPPEKKGRAIGIWITMVGLGLSLGPVIGGFIVDALNWQWIFLINIPIAFVCLIITVITISEPPMVKKRSKIDWYGWLCLFLGIALLVLAFTEGGEKGWDSLTFILFLVLSVCLLAAFGFIEKRTKEPIVRLDLFLNKSFLSCAVANFSAIFFYWGAYFLIPLYLDTVLQDNPFHMGLMMLAITLPVVVISPIVGNLKGGVAPKIVITLGLLLMAVSALMQGFLIQNLILAFLLMGIGWAIMFGPATTLALSNVPKEMTAVASGAIATIQEIGGAVGLAIAVSVFRTKEKAHSFEAGYSVAMWVLAAVLLASTLLFVSLLKTKKKIKNNPNLY